MRDSVAPAPSLTAAGDESALVGRDHERAQLDALLDRASGGRSGVLRLRGEAGIGKSALLEYAVARAREREMRVVSAVCVEAEAELPFSALHQLLRPLATDVPSLVDAHRRALESALGFSAERVDDRFLIGAATLSLLAFAAESQPLLCVVDDAHWLDGASREALFFAARRLEAESVALLVAERPAPRHDLPTLSVPPLGPDDARSLLERRYTTGLSPSVRDRLVRSAAGNPLALVEFAGALTEEQRRGHDPLPEPLFVSGGIEDSYRDQVLALPADTQTLLVIAAAEGTGDAAVVLSAAAAQKLDAAALEPAEASGLVRVVGQRVEFRHPLVRSVVYAAATVNDRLRAHRALADVLVRRADADRRAWHLAAATIGTDEEVADALEETAERALARAGFAAASAALEQAARLTAVEEVRARRLVAAGDAALHAGDGERALVLLDDAGEPEEAVVRAGAVAARAGVELRAGTPAAAVPLFLAAAEEAAQQDPHGALRCAMRAAEAAALGGAVDRVPEILGWVETLGELDRAEDRLIRHLLTGLAAVYSGDPAAGVPSFSEAVALTAELRDPAALHWAATAANYLGDGQRAEALYRSAVERARVTGDVFALPFSLVRLATVEFGRGARAASEADASEALRLATETGQEPVRAHCLALLAQTAAARGAQEECSTLAAAALELALPRRLLLASTAATFALAELDLALGRSLRALERFESLFESGDAHPLYRIFGTPTLVEAAARAGWPDRVRTWFGVYERWADAAKPASVLPLVERCRALLGDGDPVAHYEEALRLHSAAAEPFERARTALAYGELLRRAKRKIEARVHLRAALDAFDALGSAPWAERARTELRATGETARKRSDDAARDELTPQELQVARLVSRGATNREVAAQLFVSPKTVEYHLHKVFMKLGVSSRVELARLDFEGDEAAAAV